MGTATDSLSEPRVLAHTKRRLFPDGGSDSPSYVVADTQFAREEWLPGQPVDPAVRDRLAPFNHVRIGAATPTSWACARSSRISPSRLGDEPPLIAVEAKGYASGGVDTRLGIVQAHDRLHEANAAYVAAPAGAISGPTGRSHAT